MVVLFTAGMMTAHAGECPRAHQRNTAPVGGARPCSCSAVLPIQAQGAFPAGFVAFVIVGFVVFVVVVVAVAAAAPAVGAADVVVDVLLLGSCSGPDRPCARLHAICVGAVVVFRYVRCCCWLRGIVAAPVGFRRRSRRCLLVLAVACVVGSSSCYCVVH